MELIGETAQAPATDEREPINVSPEAKKALRGLLTEPELKGVGYSEFILRAVEAARAQMERHRKYVEHQRGLIRTFGDNAANLSDEECDALLAKLDAAVEAESPPRRLAE